MSVLLWGGGVDSLASSGRRTATTTIDDNLRDGSGVAVALQNSCRLAKIDAGRGTPMGSELESIGDYTISGRLLDDPGVGRVLVGRKRGADEIVAVKVLETEDLDVRSAFLERSKFLERLDHVNLARTLESGSLPPRGAP